MGSSQGSKNKNDKKKQQQFLLCLSLNSQASALVFGIFCGESKLDQGIEKA